MKPDTTQLSDYLQYLPEVLWSRERDPTFFLGRMLRVFEKILTGIPDENQIIQILPSGKKRVIEPLEQTINNLPNLFNPWLTPSIFLEWLASWVALEFGAEWSEFQKRKLTSEIMRVYQQRGTKRSLYTYLGIYASSKARPRIAIDDGEAIVTGRLLSNDLVQLHGVAYSQVFSSAEDKEDPILGVLLHPVAIAVDRQNNYIVVDQGVEGKDDPQELRKVAIWRLSSTGEIEYTTDPTNPLPKPLYRGNDLHKPTAIVVDDQDNYIVLDAGRSDRETAIYRFGPDGSKPSTVISSPELRAVYPVDMALDKDGRLIILDRGVYPQGTAPSSNTFPILWIVAGGEIVAQPYDLRNYVVEPTALTIDAEGRYIVADARDQFRQEPARLVRIEGTAEDVRSTSLLDGLDQNPLVFPTGLVYESPNSLLVCDSGLRWGFREKEEGGITGGRSNRSMAEPAAIYRISLSETPPTIHKITPEQKLATPTKMVMDRQGRLVITDQGKPIQGDPEINWRERPHEFGVMVHFSQERSTSRSEREKLRREITKVIQQHKPGHSLWHLESE